MTGLYLLILLFCAACPGAPGAIQGEARGGGQRIGVPEWLACPRDRVTSYNGAVLALKTTGGRTVIRIRTDWETTESVTIRHPQAASPIEWFRLNGEPFKTADWALIEVRKGRLRPGARANIWVCEGGGNAVVDWQVQK